MRVGAFLLSWFLCAGCTVLADRDDYLAYRKVRLAQAGVLRMRAMRSYLTRFPEGNWAQYMQADLAAREEDLFRAGLGAREALLDYLELYPQGHFAEQARARLQSMEEAHAQSVLHAPKLLPFSDARSAHSPMGVLLDWVELLCGLEPADDPLAALVSRDAALRERMGTAPAARCTADECLKELDLSYTVPIIGGTRVDRGLELWVRLLLSEGRVSRAELLLPDAGFVRAEESAQRTLIAAPDQEARRAALRSLIERVANACKRSLPYAAEASAGAQISFARISDALHAGGGQALESATAVFALESGPVRVEIAVAGTDGTARPVDGVVFEYALQRER